MFKKAERKRVKLKLAITGPSGSGKTFSANRLARGLIGPTGRIAYIDTENGSASLYADRFTFDVCNIADKNDFRVFGEAITAAAKAGYDLLIIDSFSHVWEAILSYKSQLDARGGNSYTNWNEAGTRFKSVLDAILGADIHVICCLRAKTEYVIEQNDKGKHAPRKVGMAPIMRDGIEFEFTTVFDLDIAHNAQCSKDRTGLFADRIFLITEETGQALKSWLDGSPVEMPKPAVEPIPEADSVPEDAPATKGQVDKLELYWNTLKKTEADRKKALKWLKATDAKTWGDLTEVQADRLIKQCQKQLNDLADGKPEPATEDKPEPRNVAVPAWIENNEDLVNAKLMDWDWLKPGQTYRALSAERIKKILDRPAAFATAAGINPEEVSNV